MTSAKRWTLMGCGAALALLLAVCAYAAPLPGSNADRSGPTDTFHSATDTSSRLSAYGPPSVTMTGPSSVTMTGPSSVTLAGPRSVTLRRGRTATLAAPQIAGLGLPMVGVLVGMLGLAIQGNPRSHS